MVEFERLGQLQAALEMAERLAPVEARVREAMRAGILEHGAVHERIEQARERGLISAEEARQLLDFDNTVLAITGVDDFDPAEIRRIAQTAAMPFHDTAGVVG